MRPSDLRRWAADRHAWREPLIVAALAAALYWVPQWLWDWSVPLSQLIFGVIVGSLTALTAFGIALVYRANRVINFAQADLGAVPASLAVSLVTVSMWSFWIAIPLALLASVALGALVELIVIRRFANAPRLILMVVTIGLAQILAGLAVAIPFWLGATVPSQRLPVPFDLSYDLNGYIFHSDALIALVVTVVAIVALFSFLRFTSIGIALRASAERSDRAGMLGVNVGLTHNVTWIIATVLSATTLILRAAVIGLPLGPALGPAILLRALTAAVIGRMERFSIMFLASCGLGIVEVLIVWNTRDATIVDPVMFVVVLAALLLQRRSRESRLTDQAVSTWKEAAAVRPIPLELSELREVRWTLRGLVVVVAAALVALPFVLDPGNTNLAAAVGIYAIAAISLVILTGWAGEISLGQVAFVAIGAAAASAANIHWQLDPALSFLLAACVGAVASVIIGLPALRIHGLMLAVTSLAFAVATPSFLLNRDQSLFGISFDYLPDSLLDTVERFPQRVPIGYVRIDSERQFYFVVLIALGLVLLAVRGLQRSRNVRDLMAVRDNERNAQAFRLTPARVKLLAFAMSGFFASFAGGILALHQRALGEDIFAPIESIRVLTMVVVGGLNSVVGAVLGAVFIKSTEWFQGVVPLNYRFLFRFAGSGVGLIVVLWLLPGGLGSLIYRVRDAWLRRVAARHELRVPSLFADSGVEPVALHRDGATVATVAATYDSVEMHPPRWMRRLPWRKAPDVDYFSYPDLSLSGARPNLLSIRSVDVSYGQVQVLFGVNLEVREGETIALLGTNGAGKSTVLRAISGLVTPSRGTVSHEGIDISSMAPHHIARRGIIQVPGGKGVFPSLSVAENLRVAVWMHRRDREYVEQATAEALELFPILDRFLAEPAANLSGGQQQMLALAMAFLAKPKLLMIDELSLGLAPTVVEQLLEVVKRFRADGVTVILVEQSVNVALTVADKAFFMEKGAVRFHGLTAELLARPDLMRSIFLEGSAAATRTHALPTSRPARARLDGAGRRTVLEVEGVSKRFGGLMALSNVSLRVDAGEIVGVIGPNGAGKTTLFDLISGFLLPNAGHVRLDGTDITDWRPQRRAMHGLARSFQDARLFDALTVHQTICVAIDTPLRPWDPIPAAFSIPRLTYEPRVHRRADELIELMGLRDYRDKLISDLSTGSRRIVDLACQIGIAPTVVLFDEPSSGIAQRETEALGPLLLDIREATGAGILLIEHDMPLVTAVSDRIVACDLGRVVIEGDAETVLNDPHVVASYLGSTREVIERSVIAPAEPTGPVDLAAAGDRA